MKEITFDFELRVIKFRYPDKTSIYRIYVFQKESESYINYFDFSVEQIKEFVKQIQEYETK